MGVFGCCRRHSEVPPPTKVAEPAKAELMSVVTSAPCEEIAGEYLVLRDVYVRQEVALGSSQVGVLHQGCSVTIAEVVNLVGKRRIRGRVKEPAGWITLRDLDSGVVWASRTMKAADRSNLKAGDALLSMSELSMRLDESLDSKQVALFPEGEALEVLQVGVGRRIQVKSTSGKIGWVSLATEDGVPLLMQQVGTEQSGVAMHWSQDKSLPTAGVASGDPSVIVVHNAAKDAAASKIQAVHRGKGARKSVSMMKDAQQDAGVRKEYPQDTDLRTEPTETHLGNSLKLGKGSIVPDTSGFEEVVPPPIEPLMQDSREMFEKQRPWYHVLCCTH